MSQSSLRSPAPAVPAKAPSERLPRRRAAAGPKSEQRIRDILSVGREVFAEKGYERTTTTEIAQRLGVSEATVFTYFRSKRELCVQVIGDWYDEIVAAIETGLPRDRSVREQLRFIIHTHLRLFLIQGTGLCALVLSEGRSKGGPGQDLSESFLPLQRRYTVPLMDLLARGQAAGEIRADMPLRLLRSMVFGPMEHILWEAVARNQLIDVDATTESLMELLWACLRAPQGDERELFALRQLRSDVRAALDRVDLTRASRD